MSITVEILVSGNPAESVGGVPYTPGMNVQQAMEAVYVDSPPLHDVLAFEASYFGPALGYELVGLDAIRVQAGAENSAYLFWQLSINGQVSPSGMDQTAVDDSDVVSWNYIPYLNDQHDGTRHQEIRKALSDGRAVE